MPKPMMMTRSMSKAKPMSTPFEIKSVEDDILDALAQQYSQHEETDAVRDNYHHLDAPMDSISDNRLPEVTINISGFDPKIGQMTAEAIRTSGVKVASDLLQVAEQARQTADAIEKEATDIAKQIQDATDALANRLSAYIGSCKSAVDSFKQYRQSLADLPKHDDGGIDGAI